MTDFCGRLARDGCLTLDGANGCTTIEEYVGCQVLVSGYIGDRAALCRTLGLGPPRRPNDAELLAHAFRRWGVDLEQHVIGEFAAVIADRNARVALFTHDSLGLVPLFHAQDPAGLAFSTTLLPLLDSRRCAALDEDYLAEFLATGSASGQRTPFPSIQRLLPGHSLWWSDGRIGERSGWNFGDIPPQRYRNDGEYEARLRAELDAGIASAIGTQGKTWVFLSGGLDSSSIACMAARRGGSQLAAYSTVHQAWPSVDEQPWMKAVIDETGLDWHKLDIETMLPFSRLPESFLGEPTHAVIDVAEHGRQAGLIREHGVSTLLTGHGGDVTFGAMASAVPVHLSDPLFDFRPMQALRDADRWRRDAHERRSTAFWMLRGLVEPALHHLSGRRVSGREPYDSPPWFQPDFARSRGLERRGRLRLGPRCRHPGRQATADALWVCGMAMATVPPNQIGLRARSPLMYRPLVEFMWSIPWNQVLQPRCDRYLQRRALKGVLPELVRGRAGKSEGTTVLSEGLRRSRRWIDYLCDTPLMAAHGIVDAEKWRQAVRQASVGHTHGDKHFLACVAVEAWFKQLEAHRAGSAVSDLRQGNASVSTSVAPPALIWRAPEEGKLLPLAAFVPVLRSAVAAAPDRVGPKQQLARMLYRTHAFQDLIDWARPMLDGSADADAEVLYLLGLSALAVDDRSLAFEALRASSLRGFAGSFGFFAEVLLDDDHTDEALAAALEGLDRSASDFKAFVVAARILLNRGEHARLWSLCKTLQSRDAWFGFIPSAMALAASTPEQRAEAATLLGQPQWFSAERLPAGTPELNGRLAYEIARHGNLTPLPATKATIGDGERIDQLEHVGGEAAQELLTHLRASVERYAEARTRLRDHPMVLRRPEAASMSAWAVVVRQGGHESWHVHPDGWISGVYYVQLPRIAPRAAPRAAPRTATVGDPADPPPGAIEFGPFPFRPTDALKTEGRWHVVPEPGLLLLFPSFYAHRTWPTEVPDDRIVVAFDVVPSASLDGGPIGSAQASGPARSVRADGPARSTRAGRG